MNQFKFDPAVDKEHCLKVWVKSDFCTCLINGTRVPKKSTGVVSLPQFARVYKSAVSVVHFYLDLPEGGWKYHFVEAKHLEMYPADAKNVEAVHKGLIEESQKQELDEVSDKQKTKPADKPKKFIPMAVANTEKVIGKYLIAQLEDKGEGKFAINVLCGEGEDVSDQPNSGTPLGLDSEKKALETCKTIGLESTKTETVAVFKLMSVLPCPE